MSGSPYVGRARRGRLAEPEGLGLGMRRVSWVRITVTDLGTTCEVVGIGHRLPVTRRVPPGTAAALIADGVPAVFHGDRDVAAPAPAIGR